MGAPTEQDSTPEIEAVGSHDVEASKAKSVGDGKDGAEIEAASVDEGEKGSYSKLSVWLMVLFSGLAIGSDG